MKKCSVCKIEFSITNFYHKGKSGRLMDRCRGCFNTYCVERWKRIKIETIIHFGNKCGDCQTTFHPNVYEFHHLDSTQKEYSWGKLRLFSPKKRMAELDKCVMLCANCHRIRHID